MKLICNIRTMHIKDLDLNLLRIFDTIYTTRSVSKAADRLNLTQPATSQGLARLRSALDDALFERVGGGVRPSPRAELLAPVVRASLAMLEQALAENGHFNPATERRRFHLHMSDIGEGRFLPKLMVHLHQVAPGVCIDSQYLEPAELTLALDIGKIDFAFGFLPQLKGMRHAALLSDRYLVLVRKSHPFASLSRRHAIRAILEKLDYVAVRSHADTVRILQTLHLEERLRLTVAHFTALPEIVRETDLAAIVPLEIAQAYPASDYALLDPGFPGAQFEVFLHWNKRFENDPGNRWFREQVTGLFCKSP